MLLTKGVQRLQVPRPAAARDVAAAGCAVDGDGGQGRPGMSPGVLAIRPAGSVVPRPPARTALDSAMSALAPGTMPSRAPGRVPPISPRLRRPPSVIAG